MAFVIVLLLVLLGSWIDVHHGGKGDANSCPKTILSPEFFPRPVSAVNALKHASVIGKFVVRDRDHSNCTAADRRCPRPLFAYDQVLAFISRLIDKRTSFSCDHNCESHDVSIMLCVSG